MNDLFALPTIPALKDKRWIDLHELGTDSLLTYIKYDGIAVGDMLNPNWRGCSANGTPSDLSNSPVIVAKPAYTEELGMPVRVPNHIVASLDQGWAFYSYSVGEAECGVSLPDSQRLFIYIGERVMQLPVAQIKESHGLAIHGDDIGGSSGASVVIAPYLSMAEGDKVTCTWEGNVDGNPEIPWVKDVCVKQEDIGKPLIFNLPRQEVILIEGGYADLYYSIKHIRKGGVSDSDIQRFDIVEPSTGRLPVIEIEGYTGGVIDPKNYPDGLRLQVIPLYPSIQPGDDVLFYIDYSDVSRNQVYWLRVDSSTLSSDELECVVPAQLLIDSLGQNLTIGYQYARLGNALSNEAVMVLVDKFQDLPAPIIEGALPGNKNQGTLAASVAVSGVTIHVPEQVILKPDETLELHWQGHPSGGSTIVGPSSATGKKFYIEPEFVAANMGSEIKRFPVFYRIKSGKTTQGESVKFELRVTPPQARDYPSVQCKELAGSKTLSLSSLGEDGAKAYSNLWMFAAEDQLLTIIASGVSAGAAVEITLRNAGKVTALEIKGREVSAQVPLDFLQALDLGENMALKFFVSFDNGDTAFYPFVQLLDIKVVA